MILRRRILFSFYVINFIFGSNSCDAQLAPEAGSTSQIDCEKATVISPQDGYRYRYDRYITHEKDVIGTQHYWQTINLWKARIANIMPDMLGNLYIDLPIFIGPSLQLNFVLHDETTDHDRLKSIHLTLENVFEATGVTIQLIHLTDLPSDLIKCHKRLELISAL